MTIEKVNPLMGERLITITEAANNFGGIAVPLNTVRKYIYQGVKGLKLESILINGRYTSREAIQRFIERKQNIGQPTEKEKTKPKRMTQAQIDAGLKRYGIVGADNKCE
jgi:myo-inositol catabolism protein IolC